MFFQLPTTLPLAKAKRVAIVKDESTDTEEEVDEAGNPFKIEQSDTGAKADKNKEPLEKRTEPQTYVCSLIHQTAYQRPASRDESLSFDQSLHRAPGGYIGKV